MRKLQIPLDNSIDGRVIHTPGHTPGSLSVILPSGEVIICDTIMRGMLRFWQPNYPLVANDMAQLSVIVAPAS